jgi:membrane protein implicated in regulation of membrane protease activity
MVLLSDGVWLVVEIGLAVFCFIDVALAREPAARWLPRWGWILALLVLPLPSSVLWLIAGRPWRVRERLAQRRLAESSRASTADGQRAPGSAAASGGTGALEARGGPGQGRWDADDAPRDGGPGSSPFGPGPALEQIRQGTADPALLDALWDLNEEHERTLKRWEDDLRRREQELRRAGANPQRRDIEPFGTSDAA